MKHLDIRQFCKDHWRVTGLYGLFLLTLLITVLFKLHSLLPGFTTSEVQTYQSSESLRHILNHPINAPYLILGWLVVKAHTAEPLVYFRMISAAIGGCSLAIFCRLLYYWHGHRVALLGTLLFGTSGWFLHIARLGTPAILMFGVLALIACAVWLQATMSPWAMALLLITSAGLMYVPGMPWLIGLCIVVNWNRLDDFFTKQLAAITIGAIAAIGMLLPLGWAIYRTPSICKTLLNLPATGWPKVLPTLRHIAAVPLHVFIYGPSSPTFSLGHLPVLNVFAAAMFAFGVYLYVQHSRLYRFKVLASLLIGASIVCGLGGPTNIGLLTPLLFLIAGAGIGYLLGQWFSVFPKNPLARGIGVTCVAILVLLVLTYNLRAYFVSWPNAASTKANFMLADIGSLETSGTIK